MVWSINTKVEGFHESILCFMKCPWNCISWNALKEKFHSASLPLEEIWLTAAFLLFYSCVYILPCNWWINTFRFFKARIQWNVSEYFMKYISGAYHFTLVNKFHCVRVSSIKKIVFTKLPLEHNSEVAVGGIFKSFANFTGKHLCWSLFLIELQTFKPGTLLKGNPTQVFSCNIWEILKTPFWTSVNDRFCVLITVCVFCVFTASVYFYNSLQYPFFIFTNNFFLITQVKQ